MNWSIDNPLWFGTQNAIRFVISPSESTLVQYPYLAPRFPVETATADFLIVTKMILSKCNRTYFWQQLIKILIEIQVMTITRTLTTTMMIISFMGADWRWVEEAVGVVDALLHCGDILVAGGWHLIAAGLDAGGPISTVRPRGKGTVWEWACAWVINKLKSAMIRCGRIGINL
jgi:hypothetical protein